ncbi:MAG: outer membrane lipoprotein carrier protein LolA [Myxococcales bacterium]|nr:outer membrane lipoprotein carrier protein LolA [Myxococcales bacterium]
MMLLLLTPRTSSAQAAPAPSSAEEAVRLAKKVQAHYESWRDLSAEFVQLYTRVATSRTIEKRGTLMLKRPGKFRWAYERPTKTLWVADGDSFWLYEPEEGQVIVDRDYDSDQLSTSVAFLFGKGSLQDSFTVRTLPRGSLGAPNDLGLLELTPKIDRSYARLVLAVAPDTGAVRETWLFTTSGDINRLILRDVKMNQDLQDRLFAFVPPKGIEVIEAK